MQEIIGYQTDKEARDRTFADYKANGNEQEKKAVKYSEPVQRVNPATGEISLDNKGRIVYDTRYYIAYPTL
jgi:hypothetical protein